MEKLQKAIAKFRGDELEMVKKNRTVKKKYPAAFEDDPTVEQKVETVSSIRYKYQMEDFYDNLASDWEEEFLEEYNIDEITARKHRDTEKYVNYMIEKFIQEMEVK